MRFDRQALVPDVNEKRKRWVVLLTNHPRLAVGAELHEHPTDQVAPLEAIQEAVRKCIPYGYTFAPKHTGRALYDEAGNALGHPSVTPQGWLVIKVSTEAGLELPGEWQVRLQGYGGARDTQIEQIDETDLAEDVGESE